MLDVRHLDHDGLRSDLDPDRVRLEPAFDPPGDDRVLVPVLRALQQLLAEVIVDGGIGAAPCRARERDRRRAATGAAGEKLG